MEPIKGEFCRLFRNPPPFVYTRRVPQIACKESRQIICKVTDHQSANRDRSRSTSHQKPRTFPAPLNRHSPHRSQSRHACSERCCEERRECGIPPEIAHLPPAARTARNTRSQRQAP